ncbi:MAG: helix-turn-helix domain-containing protein [Chitinophagaceae bacterium]|nr:helix-turn-helix domain-containing protein [Chitinophagaceae bacterium]
MVTINTYDTANQYFKRALQFVCHTNRHIFLTGKAGTGKTTFLRYIRENCSKKMAVLAPTGVAAINAGGTTIHSFFQLPFGPFLPTRQTLSNDSVNNEHTLFKNLRFNAEKRLLLQELELLVIDEVSMLRSDTLDAIDTILRHFRRQMLVPFGGVQMLYIGDLFQLPPVIGNEEWEILQNAYTSPFFFDSLAARQSPPLYLELKKIYRQNEEEFIHILNNIRNNIATAADLKKLHEYYKPGYEPVKDDNYIVLTTHNSRADQINHQQLSRLPGKASLFKGEITGDFNEKSIPADMNLQLKPGTQIMFVKNDKGEVRRYYNGKIGTVSKIEKDKIFISFAGKEELLLEKETWKNIRYRYNSEKDSIEEEELGSFTQYPIRLAWAVTIHKSQGLTFEKAIIDAGASFAAGQVYVALSRLTSLNGLILYSRIHTESIHTHPRVIAFTETEAEEAELDMQLEKEQKLFVAGSLLSAFNCLKLAERAEQHFEAYEHRQLPDKNDCIAWAEKLLLEARSLQEVSERFNKQLTVLLAEAESTGYEKLHQRIQAASAYFLKSITGMLDMIKEHMHSVKSRPKVKKYMKELDQMDTDFMRKKLQVEQSLKISEGLVNSIGLSELLLLQQQQNQVAVIKEEPLIAKPKKGDSHRLSLSMYREGKTIPEIATDRGLSVSTIEGHLAHFIPTGEITLAELLPEEKIDTIRKVIEETGETTSSALKEKLGEQYSYGEIRMVLADKKKNIPQ